MNKASNNITEYDHVISQILIFLQFSKNKPEIRIIYECIWNVFKCVVIFLLKEKIFFLFFFFLLKNQYLQLTKYVICVSVNSDIFMRIITNRSFYSLDIICNSE